MTNKTASKTLLLVLGLLIGALIYPSPVGAALDSTFGLSPSSDSFLQECDSSFDIRINPGTNSVNAADIIVEYSPSKIQIVDSISTVSGTQILPGDAFESYFGNQVNSSSGTIRLTGASFGSTLSGTKTFATVEFKSKPGVTSASFTIRFIGAGATISTDSNIADADTSLDTLGSVTNATYSFVGASCGGDITSPQISFVSPEANASTNPPNSKVQFAVSDGGSGIDINSLQVIVNGQTYTVGDSAVRYTGSASRYTITFTETGGFPGNKASAVTVVVSDLAGNSNSDTLVFNILGAVGGSVTCPFVEPNVTTCIANSTNAITGQIVALDNTTTVLEDAFDTVEILNNETVRTVVRNVAVPTLFIPLFIQLVIYAFLLIDFISRNIKSLVLGYVVGKGFFKGEDVWGGVYSSVDQKPLSGALVILGDKSGNFFEATLTNSQGEFGFTRGPGEYVVRISKNGYAFPSLNRAAVFSGLVSYQNEGNDKVFYTSQVRASRIDLFMDPDYVVRFIDKGPSKIHPVLFAIWNITSIMFIVGFLSALVSLMVFRVPLYLGVVILYIMLGIANIIGAFVRKDRVSKYLKSVNQMTDEKPAE